MPPLWLQAFCFFFFLSEVCSLWQGPQRDVDAVERGRVSVRRGEHKGHIQVTGLWSTVPFQLPSLWPQNRITRLLQGSPNVSHWASPKHDEMALQTHSSPVRPSVCPCWWAGPGADRVQPRPPCRGGRRACPRLHPLAPGGTPP